MASRLELHEELCELLGSRNVYFQPPESFKMKYPCIVYSLAGVNKQNANDQMYKHINQYTVTTIADDPDSDLHINVLNRFPMCSFNRGFTADDLNHNSLTLYY